MVPARVPMGVGSGALWIGIVLAVIERYPGEEYRRLTGVLGAYAVGAVAGPAFGSFTLRLSPQLATASPDR